MNKRQARQAQQARNAMQGARPSDVLAAKQLQEESPDVLAALVSGVIGMCEASQDDSDVMSLAAATVARMWQDRRNGAPIPAVVAYAVRMARQTLALAGWDTAAGDMTDMATLVNAGSRDGDERTTLAHYGTAPADAQYGTTYSDVVRGALQSLPDEEATTLQRCAVEWLAHEESDCCSGAGRRVTLAGITAHVERYENGSSDFWGSRRVAVRAVRMVDREGVLQEYGAPNARPTYGRNGVNVGNGSPSHDVPDVLAGSPGRVLPAVQVTRQEWRTVDYVWQGSHDFRVRAWTGERVESVPAWCARANGWRMADVQGYPACLGYGSPATTASGAWRAVREESTTTRSLPAVTLPGRPTLPGPDVVIVVRGDEVTMRAMTDEEATLAGAPTAGREETVYGLQEESPNARPDDSPARGDRTPAGVLKAYKPVVSSRKRTGANTGPTVPARVR